MKLNTNMQVNRVTDEIWEIPPSEKSGMLVPARIYATKGILQAMDSGVFDQVTNVACLPAWHSPVCALYAGWALGLWISYRGRRGVRCAGRRHFSRRCRLRYQLRDAADSNRLNAGGRAASSREAHDRTLPESTGRRRGERIRSAFERGVRSGDDPWGQGVWSGGTGGIGISSAWKKAAASRGSIHRS